MDKIIFILGCVSFMWCVISISERFIEAFEKPNLYKWLCLKCWSFWFTLITGIIVYQWEGILLGGLAGLCGYFLDHYLTEKNL